LAPISNNAVQDLDALCNLTWPCFICILYLTLTVDDPGLLTSSAKSVQHWEHISGSNMSGNWPRHLTGRHVHMVTN